jgi:phage I-like protein
MPSKTRTSLPDSAFAIVETVNGKKVRKLPHHNASGGVDLAHLRNALARVNQVTGVSAGAKARAKTHLTSHARSSGVGDHSADAHIAQFFALPTLTLKEENGRYTSRIPVLPEGKFTHPWYGDLDFTAPVLRKVKRNFDGNILGTEIAVDEGHDRGKALGWFKSLHHGKSMIGEAEHNGLFADVEWTDLGRSLLERDIYRYFSAEIGNFTGSDGKKVANVLFGGGLTNRPFFKQMPPVKFEEGKAEEIVQFGLFSDILWQFEDSEGEEESVDDRSFFSGYDAEAVGEDDDEEEDTEDDEEDMNYAELIANLNRDFSLQLSTDNEDETTAAIVAAFSGNASLATVRRKFTEAGFKFDNGADLADVVLASYNALRTQNTENTTAIAAIRKELDDTKAAGAVDKLVNDGKIVPAKRDQYIKLFHTNNELFTEMTKDLEPVVPLGEIGGDGVPTAPGAGKEGEFKDPGKAKEEAERYLHMVPILEDRMPAGRK